MDFNQLWRNYKELILVIATAIATLAATLLGQKILPGLWKALVGLLGRLSTRLGRRLSAEKFERRYLEWLCEEQRFLRIRGIRTRSPVSVELEKVYVSLTLNKPSQCETGDRTRTEVALREGLPESMHLEPGLRPEMKAAEPERLTVGQALQRCPERLVILGGPGTGKTTLLSYLVLKFARGQAKEALGLDEKRLPISIPLRELPRTGLHLTAESLPALCVGPEMARECPEDFFKKHLKDGNCIVLLDGMDEVTTEEERRKVAEQIEDFVATYSDNRFIVTSRPAGYSGATLAGFTQLDICDFRDEDVEAFARYWCLAVELAVGEVESEMSEAVARRKAEREAGELVAAIRASDRVRRLTVNPLLLTIVAMVHRYRATLPNRRVELYDECTEVLLGYWDQAKGIAGQLDWARKRRVLEPLAYWMHRQGLREAERVQVEQAIAGALPTVGETETKATEFLKDVQDRSGLLMERGLDVFGFSHLTFQEYLVASYLIDREEEGREELLRHLYDPWWLEVTLLYAGMRDATALIEAILAQRDDLFRNNLFLAARCLVDVVKVEPCVEEQVLSHLLQEFRVGEFEGLREEATAALIALGHSPSGSKVVAALLERLADKNEDVCWSAASALGRLGQAEPQVVAALLERLGDASADVRGSAAYALGELGQAEPQVVAALLERLGDENEAVRGRTIPALAGMGQAQPQVVAALLERLGDASADMRRSAAYALAWSGQAQPQVVAALLERLGDENEDVRGSAAYALGRLGQAEPQVVAALLERLGDTSANVRWHAAHALAWLGQAEPQVVAALLERLGDESANGRWIAASALGRLGQAGPQVVAALLERLGDASADVRRSAASTLARLGQAQPQVVAALLERLGHENEDVRGSAAMALDPQFSFSGEEMRPLPPAIPTLHHLLGDETEVEYPLSETRSKVKDVAWRLLQRYSEKTGERIYRDEGR